MQVGLRRLTFELLAHELPCADIHALVRRHKCRLIACEGRNALTNVRRSVEQVRGEEPLPTIAYDIARTQREQARYVAEAFARVLIARHGWQNGKTLTHAHVVEVADALEELVVYWRAITS